jgi:hypothetical protein
MGDGGIDAGGDAPPGTDAPAAASGSVTFSSPTNNFASGTSSSIDCTAIAQGYVAWDMPGFLADYVDQKLALQDAGPGYFGVSAIYNDAGVLAYVKVGNATPWSGFVAGPPFGASGTVPPTVLKSDADAGLGDLQFSATWSCGQ